MKKVITHTETVVKETVRYILDNHEKRLIKKLVKRDGHWFKLEYHDKPRFFTFRVKRDHLNEPIRITMVVVDFVYENSYIETVNLLSDWRHTFQGQQTWPTSTALIYGLTSMIHFGNWGHLKAVSIKNPFKKYLK